MNKRIAALLGAALVCVGAVGCGKAPISAETDLTQASSPTQWVMDAGEETRKYEDVSLQFLSCWEETAPEAAVLNQAAELFRETTGAEVTVVWSPEYYEDGDIFQMPGIVLGSNYADKVLDLTDMAEAAGYEDKSLDALRSQVIRRSGTLNAIVQTPYISGFYYNTEIFDECGMEETPLTYEAFLKLCKTLKEQGYEPMTMNGDRAGEQLLLHLSQYKGAAKAATIAKSGGWSADAGQAVADIWQFVQEGYLAYSTPAAYPGGQNRMGLSNCAFLYGTNALCAQVEQETHTSMSWGVFPYPAVGGAAPMVSVDGEVLAISKTCTNAQAAFDFIMLLTTGEFDQLRADITNGIPADPNNVSPIRGVAQTLDQAMVMELEEVEFTEKQETAILKLWQGKFDTADDFTKAMDKLYG